MPAVAIHICAGLVAAALTVHTWRTRSGVPVTAAALALFGLTFVQAGLGSQMTLALHVVVAFVLTILAAWVTFRTFVLPKTDVSPIDDPNTLTH